MWTSTAQTAASVRTEGSETGRPDIDVPSRRPPAPGSSASAAACAAADASPAAPGSMTRGGSSAGVLTAGRPTAPAPYSSASVALSV